MKKVVRIIREESLCVKLYLKKKKRKWDGEELLGEFNKIRPPIFDGESEEGA